jgi:phage terminase large subunit
MKATPLDLTEKQSAAWLTILENPAIRRVLFDGGARSTKTVLICAWLLTQERLYAGARILCARKHRNAAENSLWNETFRGLLRDRHEFRMYDSDMEIKCKNGSVLRVDGLDDQDRVDKVLGTEYAHIFFNEATQLSWATVQTVLSRLAQPVQGLPARKAIFDCNPKSQRHWLYKAGVLHVDPEKGTPLADAATWARQHWTPYDNPHLPPDALATLENLTGTQRRRMLKGEWCETDGAVYDEFEEELHVIDAMPAGWQAWPCFRAIDFGYTNPFVCLWASADPDGRLYVWQERYVARQTVQVHSVAIKQVAVKAQWTVADHDAEDRATLHAAGIPTLPALKDVAMGIKAVKERLKVQPDGRPRVFFLAACRDLIAEMYDYVWAPPAEARNAREEPVKDRDHAMDALRYLVMQLDCPRLRSRLIAAS